MCSDGDAALSVYVSAVEDAAGYGGVVMMMMMMMMLLMLLLMMRMLMMLLLLTAFADPARKGHRC